MAAKRDASRSTYFAIGAQSIHTCAAHDTGSLSLMNLDSDNRAWTVCEHLATPEKALAYHKETHPILIVHGFVLCQECNNRNILTGQDGFNRMLRTAVPQDDIFFQKFIMKEDVPDEYCYWAELQPGNSETDEKRKHLCRHLNTSVKLNSHYAAKQTLFWHHDSLMCAMCLNEINNGNMDPIEDNALKLHDNIFTEQIIGPLCTVNSEHFGLKG